MVSDFIVQGYGYLCTYNNFSVLGVNCWCHYTSEVHVYYYATEKSYEITASSQQVKNVYITL